jgi:GntR family transcriptional regulator
VKEAALAPDYKHVRVRDYLRGLVAHELAVGDTIPSERELCERFAVSRMTVRQAIDALVNEGLLHREQGRGTFVAPPRTDMELRLVGFGDDMRRRGMTPHTDLLDAETVEAPWDVAEALELEAGAAVHHVQRLGWADGRPMALEESWVSPAIFPDLLDGAPDAFPESLYATFRDHGHDPNWGEDTVSASDASEHEAELLRLGRGARTVLRIARRTFADQVACAFSRSCYRADRYTLWVPLTAPNPVVTPRAQAAVASRPDNADTGLIGTNQEVRR